MLLFYFVMGWCLGPGAKMTYSRHFFAFPGIFREARQGTAGAIVRGARHGTEPRTHASARAKVFFTLSTTR